MDQIYTKTLIDSAMTYASTTLDILSEPGCVSMIARLLSTYFPRKDFFLVADENTWEAAGKRVSTLLESAGLTISAKYIFPAYPMLEAEYSHAVMLSELFSQTGNAAPVAIGGGTINDIVKLGAHKAGRPYACVATACSVDGYASDGAALLTNGGKMTHSCPAPVLILGDSDILDKAPSELNSAGYADLMAKIPAGADWILADYVNEAPIDQVAWPMVQTNLRAWIKNPKDTSAIFTGLTICGIAMQYMKDSRPVSGAEHLLSHIWEMEHLEYKGKALLHGIKVGIGSLISTAVYEDLFSNGVTGGDPLQSSEEVLLRKNKLLVEFFGGKIQIEPIQRTLMTKYSNKGRQDWRRQQMIVNWPVLRDRLQQQLIPYSEMSQLLLEAGCPTSPIEIGLDTQRAIRTLQKAQLIRNRYTILDALDDLGLMEQVIARLDNFG